MQVAPGSTIELYPSTAYVSVPSNLGMADYKLTYDDHPAFRDQVQSLVYDFVQRHSLSLFPHVCGRCGNSCKREGVVVREQEVFRLRTRLGVTEEEFRERYLMPANTWNQGDGVIKLHNGACPFLKEGPGDTVATCSIYEDRPEDCRMFMSNAPFCRKDTGRLIEHLSWLKLTGPDSMEVGLRNGSVHNLTGEKAFWELLLAQLDSVDVTAEERVLRVASRTSKIIQEMIEEFSPERMDEKFQKSVNGLRQLVSDLACIGELGKEQPDLLERMWADFRHLEELAAGRATAPAPPPAAPVPRRRGTRVRWIYLTEEGASALYELPRSLRGENGPAEVQTHLSFHQYPALRERAQTFLYQLLTRNEDEFQEALTDPDPPCYLCGECCRVYAVEIYPSDIDRLCQLLGTTPAEFVEKYTIANRFNWNPRNRILRKEPKQQKYAYKNPRLMALPVLPGEKDRSGNGCVFLEEREDGFWYCGVHSHKPDVCRRYQPNHSLCRRTNQLRHWGRQARNLVWILIDPKEFSVMPFSKAKNGQAALKIQRRKWQAADRAARALEAEVDDILEAARRELEQQLMAAR